MAKVKDKKAKNGTKPEKAEEKQVEVEENPVEEKKEDKKTDKAGKTKASKISIKKARKKPKSRSKNYIKTNEKIDKNKKYSLEDAVKLVKDLSYSKFDGTVSVDIKLERSKKSDDSIRGTIKLPHGTGKSLNVVIATEELVEKIKKGWTDFDILVASPEMMPKLAQVAKILGPKGKMPNPKDQTVSDNPEAAAEDLGGKVAKYRADSGKNIHLPVGKVSWDPSKLSENVAAVLKAISHLKKQSVTLSPTMGPGVKIETK